MAISCFYESHGVKLVVRSLQRSQYPRHVCLQGRTESCSAKVNECYLVRHLVRCPKGTLYPRRQDGIRQQDRSDATHRDSRKQLATHRKMRKHETAVCGTARTVVWEVGKCENRRQMPLYDQHLPPTRLPNIWALLYISICFYFYIAICLYIYIGIALLVYCFIACFKHGGIAFFISIFYFCSLFRPLFFLQMSELCRQIYSTPLQAKDSL